MNAKQTVTLSVLAFFMCSFMAFSLYKTYQYQLILKSMLSRVNMGQINSLADVEGTKIIEKLVGKTNAWRPVQESVKDTVVQIVSHIAEFNFQKPYQTPRQFTAYGSGFFINDEGDIITNFHVVNQAKSIWIKVPSLGQRIIDVDIVGVSPDRDLALLRVSKEGLAIIRRELGQVSHLSLGNSDLVRRSDEVMALGYPLAQQLKSTTGVISGREGSFIQMSAPINPGSSGGPLLNINGEAVGISTAGIMGAQNVGYIIPINDLRVVLPDLYKVKLLRNNLLGVLFNNATESLTQYLGNPKPGGCYVVEVIPNSTLYKAGVLRGDMIYEINGHKVDVYGEMTVVWSEDKVSIVGYVSRLSIGQDVNLLVYRNGERKDIVVKFSQADLPTIHKVYPGFEDIDYEVFGGMVVMQLTVNHIQNFSKIAPGLIRFTEMKNQSEPVLIVTNIFPNSQLYRTRILMAGSTLNEINGMKVSTLDDFRKAIKNVKDNKFTILSSDQIARASDNVFVVLDFDKIIEEELEFSRDYKYPLSETTRKFLQEYMNQAKA